MQNLFKITKSTKIIRDDETWPLFPECSYSLTGLVDEKNAVWLTCLPLFRQLGNNSSQIYLRKRVSKDKEELKAQSYKPTHVWNASLQVWEISVLEDDLCIPYDSLKEFLLWALKRSRKTKEEKLEILKRFNVDSAIVDEALLTGPIENELLSILRQCLPLQIEFQYRVGKYRLDAFVPRLRLGIQIDENGHSGYNQEEEKEMNEVIRDSNIVCIRFNPDQKYAVPPGYELVKQVWERTLSPDFVSFREKNKL